MNCEILLISMKQIGPFCVRNKCILHPISAYFLNQTSTSSFSVYSITQTDPDIARITQTNKKEPEHKIYDTPSINIDSFRGVTFK